jgi:hypothetical protein
LGIYILFRPGNPQGQIKTAIGIERDQVFVRGVREGGKGIEVIVFAVALERKKGQFDVLGAVGFTAEEVAYDKLLVDKQGIKNQQQ